MNLNNDTGGINVFCLYIITIIFGISLQLIYIQLCRLFNLEINIYNIQNSEYSIIDHDINHIDWDRLYRLIYLEEKTCLNIWTT